MTKILSTNRERERVTNCYQNSVLKTVAVLFCAGFLFFGLFGQASADVSWLSGYDYRAKVPVGATADGAQTDYQMSIVLHSGTGTNVAGIVYFNGHLQDATNFNDIRFTASDGITLKNYWIQKVEDETGGRKATVYVKLDTPVSGTTDYYVYYGKMGDVSASSYDNTFTKDFGETGLVGLWHMDEQTPGPEILQNTGFENWTGNNIDNWTIDGTSAGVRDITKETSTVYAGTNAVKLTATNAGATGFGIYQDITTTNNENYQLTIQQRFDSRTAGILKIEAWDNTHSISLGSQLISTTATAYSTVNVRFTSTNTTNVRIKIYLTSETTTGIAYVDAISVRQSSNTLTDSSVNPITGTIYGAARTDTDGGLWGSTNQQFSTGSALNIDGKDDYAAILDPGAGSKLDITGVITAEAWVRIDNKTAPQVILAKGAALGSNTNYSLTINNNLIYWEFYSGGVRKNKTMSISSVTLGTWHHIVGIYDGVDQYIFVDTVSSTKTSLGSLSLDPNNLSLTIGKNITNSSYPYLYYGEIDDVRIYNRALSSDEISRQYIRSKYASTAPSWSIPNLEEQLTSGVTTVAVNTSTITITSAILNGYLAGFGGDASATVSFNYGLASDNLDQTTATQTMTDYGSFSQAITGLTANTAYYFQAVVTNSAGTAYGSILSFRTVAFDTDYYRTIINADGSLTFNDKNTGATILSSSPKFYLNYNSEKTILEDVTPQNSSFETDTNSDGIPDGWTVYPANTTYIQQSSEQASAGTKSLKFIANPSYTDAYSPIMLSQENAEYSVSMDSYQSSSSSNNYEVFILYYNTVNGTGTAYQTPLLAPLPSVVGSWKTTTFNWIAPKGAKSFKFFCYSNKLNTGTLYLDNVKVIKQANVYDSNNSSVSSNISTSGDNIAITSTDDSSATTTISNKYELNLHSPYIKYTPTLTYKQNTNATEERFDFTVPSQSASIMTRDLKLNTFNTGNIYYSDQYTPKVVKFDNGLSFLGNDTMQSMQFKVSGSANSQLSLYSDYSGNHPFSHQVKNGGSSSTDISSTKRSVGDTYSSSVTFSINSGVSTKSLVKARQPYGYDATVTLTNHADSELLSTINAVAYGTEDTNNQDYGTEGIVGRGIGWTKSVFVSSWYLSGDAYDELSSPDFKSLHDKLYQDGVEIVGHSITQGTDSRTTVESGMQTLSQYGARNWIDHGTSGGTNNWEALASQGTIKGDPNYSLDLFDKYGYQYAWSYNDLTTTSYDPNMIQPANTSAQTPFFYYNQNVDDNLSDSKKIYLWSTLNTEKASDLYYTNIYVDSLISERGLHIGHEYMGYSTNENHSWYTNLTTGKIEIYPTFDSELSYIATKRADGLIWSPTMATLGDYLVPLKDVLITNNTDGSYVVTNSSDSSITGVTFLAESAIQSVTIDENQLVSFGGDFGDKELVLPTLAANQSITLDIIYGTKDASVPTITSNESGKNKINEITGYWDSASKRLTMTAEGKSGDYSFTVKIPLFANKNVTVEDTGTNTVIGSYTADSSGEISFTAPLGSLHTFDLLVLALASTSSGSSALSRYNNLISMGNLQAAENLKKEFPSQLPNQISLTPSTQTISIIIPTPSTPIIINRILKLTTPRMWGDDIKTLQTFLNTKGYNSGIPDGNFGPKTQAAVIAFQKANSLTPDGVVGLNTIKFMNDSQATPSVLTPSKTRILKLSTPRMIGDDILALQTYLSTNGYDIGTSDGIFGTKTQSAVIAFQTANSLTPDGIVGSLTRGEMNK